MAIVDISSLSIGTQVSFQTKHEHDNNVYSGTIIGVGSYNVVKSMMDILPYYQAVKQVVPSMAPMTELNYFILEYSQDESARVFVCAYDWVRDDTVSIISLKQYFDIRIYNEDDSKLKVVLDLLQAHNFTCTEVPNV